MDVVGDAGDQSGPIEMAMDVLDCLGDTRVPSQEVVMVRVQDIQLDILIVRDRVVPCSKGICHLVKVTKGQVKPWLGW